ncbi:MAG: hypothetical protein IT170_18135 [Bryobacterales bacterium]|nr:hypothetical protein [Bryobacterales bacterium]
MRRLTALVALIPLISLARLPAQNLTGTVVADDTNAGIAGSTVVAVQRPAAASQMPAVYKARVDASGRFALTVGTGVYQICVYDAGLYLDPCQWGAATARTVIAGTPASVSLRLQKGVPFVVRTHDAKQLVRGAETVRGQSIRLFLSASGRRQFPLPIVYDNGRIRDYGAVVPANLSLSVKVNSASLVIADRAGAAFAAQGVPFQIPSVEAAKFKPLLGAAKWGLFRQNAKVVHIYPTARK